MPEISIIVPVYNVEKYLHRCIDSILAQTFKDFELILVDDGSPDRCGEICDEYSKKDKRVRGIHKENGGLSDARSAGIAVAKGKYLGFVDSDDYIAEDMYEVLYNNLIKNDADISACGYYKCFQEKIIRIIRESPTVLVDGREAIRLTLVSDRFPMFAWNKIYKRELFEEVAFPVGKVYEDIFAISEVVTLASRVVITTEAKYYYVQRQGSICNADFTIKDLDRLEAHAYMMNSIGKKFPELLSRLQANYFVVCSILTNKIISSEKTVDTEQLENINNELRRNIIKILGSKFLTAKRKILIIMLLCNQTVYKKLVKLYRRNRKLVS